MTVTIYDNNNENDNRNNNDNDNNYNYLKGQKFIKRKDPKVFDSYREIHQKVKFTLSLKKTGFTLQNCRA